MKAYPKKRVASTSSSDAPLALRQFLHTWFYYKSYGVFYMTIHETEIMLDG